ncbi:hypothetical protein BJAS_P2750 [Bathymodiolus japonicus methanotrophic gill symbiont]|uniref:DUF29 domain-containing protein n=1 Tax=Bathymodiolus japonicus methanotrophic gill symbiont TaxID=113269 RepID=UPI001B4AA186|nr:hypothetical protein BJAS_P2750 [Bathymodiolus japonicus methanotrophic gill symbiont]
MNNYDSDFYGWTQEQADLLKAGRLSELDIDNLLEEVETMGRSERRELDSRLTVLLIHLLKWQYQPIRQGRSWQLTIEGQRINFSETLYENSSLKPQLDTILKKAYAKSVIKASQETALDKQTFPSSCPWTLSQILDDNFYPTAGE